MGKLIFNLNNVIDGKKYNLFVGNNKLENYTHKLAPKIFELSRGLSRSL